MSFLTHSSFCCRRGIPRLRVDHAGDLADRIGPITAWLGDVCARGVFSGTVLIAQSGRVLAERSSGFADLARGAPLTSHSAYSLASVSKAFTGLGIALLAYRGALAIDDPMARHIPELAFYPGVTIRHLLHHTSGIPDHMELADTHWDGSLLTIGDLLRLYEKFRPRPYFPPGSDFEYSNAGYVMLGEIIARASGRSYPDFMTGEILTPLGMRESAAFNLTSDPRMLPNRVFGLRRRVMCFGRDEPCDLNYLDGLFGDAGIYASAADLVRFDAGLRGGVLLPNAFYAQAYRSGTLNNGRPIDYGFGWDLAPDGVFHRGEWQGFTTFVLRDLGSELLLVVLSNRAPAACVDALVGELRRALASALVA